MFNASNCFGAFCKYPKAEYSKLESDEQILLLVRSHVARQIGWVINTILLVVISIVAFTFLSPLLSTKVNFLAQLVIYTAIFTYFLFNLMHWYYNIGLVTNKRVIDIDYIGVTSRVTTESLLTKIADATAKIYGFTGQVFDYGNVFITTNGPIQNIVFEFVPNPEEVVTIINDNIPN